MMKWNVKVLIFLSFVFLTFLLIAGCKSYKDQEKLLLDTRFRGTINVSADESFKPIIDEMVQVYESNYPGTNIRVTYKPEAECLMDMGVDSVRMIIATRGYTKREENFLTDSMRVQPRWKEVARDAVSVIVNPKSADSLFTMDELKGILTGRSKNLIPVFDGVKATSTVRFIVDSVLRGDSLRSDALAAKTSEGVIDYVATHPEAVGFIGVSWIGNKDDSAQISFLRKVKIAQLESTDVKGNYVLPVQANIYYKRYPMVRDLVYILKENHRGLGHGFGDFLEGQIGQLIFKRAYLMPATIKFTVRLLKLNE
jgi:phosphate transport system substrate-binding protein